MLHVGNAGCASLTCHDFCNFPATLLKGQHPFPFRIRQLSPSRSMVLQSQGCGRVECCRNDIRPVQYEIVRGIFLSGKKTWTEESIFDRLCLLIRRNYGLNNINKKPALYGLVLAGGRSLRMKRDKSLLQYHGKSQVEYCFELLSGHCQEVYLSNREEQSSLKEHRKLPQIHDKFIDIGPLGGILSAMLHKPDTAWLVLACDLPFIDHSLLAHLVAGRARDKYATAYTSAYHPEEPEPLCAIYEPKLMPHLRSEEHTS